MTRTKPDASRQIAANKKARFDYFIEDTVEAGLALEGWEVKSLRGGKGQITESYVLLRKGEAWLFGRRVGVRGGVNKNLVEDDQVGDGGSAVLVGRDRYRPSVGVSVAVRRGTYLEGQYTAGPDRARQGWGFDMRVTF